MAKPVEVHKIYAARFCGGERSSMTLLPSKPAVEQDDVEPAVVDFSEDSNEIFSVLQSATARRILAELYDEPAVASELADRVGTSVQNIHHHLGNLRDAGIIEVAEIGYSSKGNEMKIYAPAGDPLTIVVGPSERTDECRRALDQANRE